MKEITIYECGICGERYKDRSECLDCEDSHKKPVGFEHVQFGEGKTARYPRELGVKMSDGKVMRYRQVTTWS